MDKKPILELKNITKRYPGVVALDQVSISFYSGEVHAIVGENGAGKSTLIKIMTGAISPTEGKIFFEGKEVVDNSPQKAIEMGITAVYQELNLLKYLTVAENIYYNRFPKKGAFIDYEKMQEDAGKVLEYLGVEIDPSELVKNLTVGYQQLVEIAKSLSRTVKVIIMDEPSAPLTNNELKYLFDIVKKLKEEGLAVLYISHRMEEIFQICDKVSVFRDGHYINTKAVADTTREELIKDMVNREISDTYPQIEKEQGEVSLEVKGLCTSLLKDISFKARKGERLGIAGLVGAGRTETARAIFGADTIDKGEVRLNGKILHIMSPSDAIKAGIAYLPEDRKQLGLFLNMSVKDNLLFSYFPHLAQNGLIKNRKATELCDRQIEKLKVKTPTREQLISHLSGGNQQKVIVAKWMLMDCDVIIFDEPTRGIDVGAKQEIYQLINMLAKEGKTIIVISSELPELMGISDRILVMAEGRITGEVDRESMTQEKILELASAVERK
ncbi:MAG: sugar ABC transporter ATP-binding protein [Muricoprocola sp.]